MRRHAPALLTLVLLSGCAGYAADYWRPKNSLIAPQLERYGVRAEDSRCAGERLTKNLTVWQLRQLADIARRLVPSAGNALAPRDLSYVAGLVQDPKVGPEVAATLEACNVGRSPASAAVPESAPAATPGLVPGTAAPQPLRWIDLGAAETGQRIAVDIASVAGTPEKREGWFRLSNPGAAAPSEDAYRLRVDCPGKTITPTAARKYADGKVVQQEDYTSAWQQPLPIEAGTVMEIAWKRLCE